MHCFAHKALLPGGWRDGVRLEAADGCWATVTAGVEPSAGDVLLDCVIPGIVNAHSHAFQRALAGHTEQRPPAGRDSFWSWRQRMYALAAAVDADALRVVARQLYAEMLQAGYTAVAEFHYLHRDGAAKKGSAMRDALIAAASDTGIRLRYIPVLYERAGFESPEPTADQRRFVLTVDEYLEHVEAAAAAGVATGAGVHSLRAVRPASVAAVAAHARRHGLPVHVHVAEQRREVNECLASYGRRPVRWLLENCDVDAQWCLVHATHVDVDESAALAASGAVVCLCPSTEANLGDGVFPLQRYLGAGGRIAIGSDSHVSINPFEELRWLEYGQRLVAEERNIAADAGGHTGSGLFRLALEGGAAAAGEKAGLVPGAPADLVELSRDDPMLAGHDDDSRIDALVFSGFRLPIDRVMAAGRWVVSEGRAAGADDAAAEFADVARQLRACMAAAT